MITHAALFRKCAEKKPSRHSSPNALRDVLVRELRSGARKRYSWLRYRKGEGRTDGPDRNVREARRWLRETHLR